MAMTPANHGTARVRQWPRHVVVLLFFLLAARIAHAQESQINIMIEPGQSITPDRARAPAFTLDANNLLIVVDQSQGFFLGRFLPPPGLESEEFGGGIELDEPGFDELALPTRSQTPLLYQEGFPKVLDGACAGGPCVADLDRDGSCEIIIATIDGSIHVLNHAGRPVPGWPKRLRDGFFASPTVGDLDGDGVAEIVIAGLSGHIYTWHLNGSPLAGWPICPLPFIAENPTRRLPPGSFYGPAAITDIDGDNDDEVCIGNAEGTVWLLDGDGSVFPGWPRFLPISNVPANPPGIYCAPNMSDFDEDGEPEIAVTTNAGYIHAWHTSSEQVPGWSVRVHNHARAGYGGVVSGDVNGDGQINLIVTSEHGLYGPASVAAYNIAGGMLPGWPYELPEPTNGAAALGDLTGDGVAEVVCATIGGNAVVVALDGQSGEPLPGWPLRLKDETVNSTPIIADLNGDGWNDVLVTALATGDEGSTWLWAFSGNGGQIAGFPIKLPQDEIVRSAPVVADLDGDGDLELVAATERLYNLHVWDLDATCEFDLIPWPGIGGGSSRCGVLEKLERTVNRFDFGNLITKPELNLYQGPELSDFDALYRRFEPDWQQPSPLGEKNDGSGDSGANGGSGAEVTQESLSSVPFELQAETPVKLVIFDIQHREVKKLLDHTLPPGRYSITWDGRNNRGNPQMSGIYYYRLSLGDRVRTEQFLLLK
jgi:FG-GAP-like repeat/FlgD Ig-like domain